MKLYRRYLLDQVRRPWLYVLVGFSAIAVLIDLFDNFSDFADSATPLPNILLYYLVLVPTYLPYMLPVSILLALLYALWNLGKSSEITAMRACGLSISQIASPFLALGLLSSLALLAVNESFNPWAMQWTRRFREERHQRRLGPLLYENLTYKNAPANRLWRIAHFNPKASASYELRGVSLRQQRPDGSDEFSLDAKRALWRDGHWWFEEVETQHFSPDNLRDGPVETSPQADMTWLSETPADFLNEIKDPETERSAADIRRFLQTHDRLSRTTRNRYLVDYHYRLASPWLCFVVVLLGIPFGAHTSRRGMGPGILLALLSFFGYYVFSSFCLHWGKSGGQWLPPLLAGWLPLFLFLGIGLAMLRRIR